jgi:hypothetical protein
MKVLTEDDFWGFSDDERVLYAKVIRGGSVSLGDLYRVPKTYFPSEVGKVTNIDAFNVTKGKTESFWLIDLEEAPPVEPDDPCDSDFMEEIST